MCKKSDLNLTVPCEGNSKSSSTSWQIYITFFVAIHNKMNTMTNLVLYHLGVSVNIVIAWCQCPMFIFIVWQWDVFVEVGGWTEVVEAVSDDTLEVTGHHHHHHYHYHHHVHHDESLLSHWYHVWWWTAAHDYWCEVSGTHSHALDVKLCSNFSMDLLNYYINFVLFQTRRL